MQVCVIDLHNILDRDIFIITLGKFKVPFENYNCELSDNLYLSLLFFKIFIILFQYQELYYIIKFKFEISKIYKNVKIQKLTIYN